MLFCFISKCHVNCFYMIISWNMHKGRVSSVCSGQKLIYEHFRVLIFDIFNGIKSLVNERRLCIAV